MPVGSCRPPISCKSNGPQAEKPAEGRAARPWERKLHSCSASMAVDGRYECSGSSWSYWPAELEATLADQNPTHSHGISLRSGATHGSRYTIPPSMLSLGRLQQACSQGAIARQPSQCHTRRIAAIAGPHHCHHHHMCRPITAATHHLDE